ncbi:MAG: hypothetical protein M3457_15510 [Chloroflexota bacterium]|nr:hypothetical protein [Chloroflexota bacterium]
MSATNHPTEMAMDPDAARIRQRLRALRSRYPGMVLNTQLTHIHDDQVVVRAELSLPDGSSVSAYAAEPSDSTGLLDGAIELAEQRATTRALDLLGLGEIPAATNRPDARPEPVAERTEPAAERTPPPVVDALRKASVRRQAEVERPPGAVDDPELEAEANRPEPEIRPEPAPDTGQKPGAPDAGSTDEPDMADYTWTHFWTWARANDLSTKGQVEQRIGRQIDNLTPRDVRQLLHENGIPL